MFFRICLCSRCCLIYPVLFMRKPNSSTIRAFGRTMLVAVHVSGGLFWKFLLLETWLVPCPVPWNPRQQTLSLHDMLRDMAAGEHLLLMGNQGVGSLVANIYFLSSGILHVVCIQKQKKELLAIWIDPGIAIAKGVLTAEKLLVKVHHLTAEAKINLLIASWCCYTVNATA